MTSGAAATRTTKHRSRASAIAWSLAGLYVVLVLLAFRFGSEAAPITLVDVWVFFGMLWFAVIGALIVGRHPRHLIGWMFCVTALSFGASAFAQSYAIVAISAEHRGLPAGQLMAWLGFWINMPGTAVIALFLPLLFPDGRLPSRRWRPVAWAAGALVIVAVLVSMFRPRSYAGFALVRNPLGIEGWDDLFEFIDVATDIVFALLIVLTSLALFERLRRAGQEERLQIRWFVFAGCIVVVGFLSDLLHGFVPELQDASLVLTVAAVTALPAAVGIAILRYRLYEIDVIINRTLVYGLLTAVLAGLYTAALALFQRLFVAITGQGSDLAIVMTLFVLATVFTPIKTSLQAAVDGRLKPAKSDPSATSATGLDDLMKLAELHRHGVLTDEEFSAKKRQILGI
ncbi:MAG: SHOCT domain-containing protein [Chloroflexota bacterium]|nr:SHOCT domain-containing protein [Chloroflexota bacterium]